MATHRTGGAEGRDDRDLEDDAPTPSFSGTSGGSLGADIGSRDEEREAMEGEGEPERVRGADKLQPNLPNRSDAAV